MDEELPDTKAGAANDETEIIADPPRAETPLQAWSDAQDDADEETERHPWSAVTSQAAALITAGAAVATVVAVLGWIMLHKDRSTPAPPPPPVPSASPTAVAPPPTTAAPTQMVPSPTQTAPTQSPVLGVAPSFGGRYQVTETWANGHVVTEMWNVAPCGTGCVDITPDTGGDTVRATLHGAAWAFGHSIADDSCPGSHGGAAFLISADTLSGTVTKSFGAVCGNASEEDVDKISLTKIG
jgi:hypothetical protein